MNAIKVNLKRVLVDLQRQDEDLVLLALSNLRRAGLASGRYPEEALEELSTRLRELALNASGEIQSQARDLGDELKRNPILQQPDSLSISAVIELQAREPDAALLSLEEFVELPPRRQLGYLRGWATSQPAELREFCLAMLGLEGTDPTVQAACLTQVGLHGEHADLLEIRPFLNSSDGRVRANAIEAIERLGDPPEVFAVLLPHLKDPEQRARANALKALSSLDSAMVLGALRNMVLSPSVAAKASALYVLSYLQSPEALELQEILARDASEEVRRRVAESLGGKQGDRVEALLEVLVNDRDVDVAECALEVLEELYRLTGRDLVERVRQEAGRPVWDGDEGPPGAQDMPPLELSAYDLEEEDEDEDLEPDLDFGAPAVPAPVPDPGFDEESPPGRTHTPLSGSRLPDIPLAGNPTPMASPSVPASLPELPPPAPPLDPPRVQGDATRKVSKVALAGNPDPGDATSPAGLATAGPGAPAPLPTVDASSTDDLPSAYPPTVGQAAAAPGLVFEDDTEDFDPDLGSREVSTLVTDFGKLPPGQQEALVPVFEALDGALVDLGARAVEALDGGRLAQREIRKLRSLAGKLQAHLDLERSKNQGGFLARWRPPPPSEAEELLLLHLEETHRQLGESLVELQDQEEIRFGELDGAYRRVEELLDEARATEK